MKKIWLIAGLLLGIAPFIAPATAQESGDTWTVGSYCIGGDPKFIGDFTDAIVRGGLETYRAIMRDTESPCYDTRMHSNIKPVQVVLIEKLWDFTLPGGEALTMWVIQDVNGRRGYTWLTPEGYVETDPA